MAPRYQIEKTVWIRKSQKKLQLWAILGRNKSRNTCQNSFSLQGRVRRSTREEQNVDVWSAKKNIQQTEEKFIALFKILLFFKNKCKTLFYMYTVQVHVCSLHSKDYVVLCIMCICWLNCTVFLLFLTVQYSAVQCILF